MDGRVRTDGDSLQGPGGRLGVEPRGLSSRTLVWNFSQASPMAVLDHHFVCMHRTYVRLYYIYITTGCKRILQFASSRIRRSSACTSGWYVPACVDRQVRHV